MSSQQKNANSMKKALWIVLPIVIIAVVVVAVFAGQSNSLTDQIAKLEADKAAMSQDMDMAVRTAQQLADTQVSTLTEQLEAADAKAQELETKLQDAETTIADQAAAIAEQIAAIAEKDAALNENAAAIAAKDATIAEQEVAIAERDVAIEEKDAALAQKDAAQYIDTLAARIRELMEKRGGTRPVETDKDLAELEKALAELEKGIVAQYYRPEEVKQFCEKVKAEILALITKTPDPMTTWELNEALKARLDKYVSQTDSLIAKRDAANAASAYAKLLAEIDAEVSFDSQIAMAEDAIAKQLGIKCPAANLKMNALLGEYARTMRLLKLGKKIEKAQATVALLGGVYLDQPAVVTRALELGADVNGTSDRDPFARTGILLAIQVGHISFIKQLADAKAALNPVDAKGDTALHYAVRRGNLAVVKAMLAKNDVNKANAQGESAIFIAVRKNQAAIAAALTAAKADVTVKNAKGVSVMDAACLAGSRDVLDVLGDAGAEYGPAQLIIAAQKNRLAVAQWLIGKGVDVNAPGVMEATVCKTDTQCYLVHEGGLLKQCPKDCGEAKEGCKKAEAPKAAATEAKAAPAKIAEATGTINFKVSEVK